MTTKGSQQILTLLNTSGHLSDSNVKMLMNFCKKWNTSGFNAILETRLMSESDLADTLAESLRIDRIFHLRSLNFEREAYKKVGFKRAKKFVCLPVGFIKSNSKFFEMVVADPTTCDSWLKQLKEEFDCEIRIAIAEKGEILKALDELFPISEQIPDLYEE